MFPGLFFSLLEHLENLCFLRDLPASCLLLNRVFFIYYKTSFLYFKKQQRMENPVKSLGLL